MIEIDTIFGRKCTSSEGRTVCMSRILVLIALGICACELRIVQGIRARSIARDNGVGILVVSCNHGGE